MLPRLLLFLYIVILSHSGSAQQRVDYFSSSATKELQQELRQKKEGDSITVLLSVKNFSEQNAAAYRVLYRYQSTGSIIIRTTKKALSELLQQQDVFAASVKKPVEELTTGAFDLGTNKINWAQRLYPTINGTGINISVKEQQFDTTDIDIKGRNFSSGVAAGTQSSHAAIMATIMAGAGNSSPYAKGVATGAALTSADFSLLLPEPDSVYRQNAISVQNHSYGTGIENYYGADAAAYDQSVYNNPMLVHVFSAGNSGNNTPENGTYTGLQNVANITGSFKMSKNSISVGHTDSLYHVLPLSSRGPAYDGRIKPELVAYGEDGSSGAAALVSGSVALLQQAYRQTHNQLPSAALVKSALITGAEDVGMPGPDYISGYGSLQTEAALQVLLQHQFFEDSVAGGATTTFSITLPNNAAYLKVTLVWTDLPAATNAPKALINDLDMQLDGAGKSWLPWVLSPVANIDSLQAAAQQKKDTLNNVEQISVDHPQGGNYTISITGSIVKSNAQAFAVTYQFNTVDAFQFTYPTAADVIESGRKIFVRWQTSHTDNAVLEYAPGNNQWQTLATAALQSGYFSWTVPDTTTIALLRVRFPTTGTIYYSDTFVISKPLQLNVGFNCADSFLLFWNKLSVPSYQLYNLGAKYLQPVLITNDTSIVLKKTSGQSFQYSVAPLLQTKPGFKSYAIDYSTQGVGCYLRSFFAGLQNGRVLLQATIGAAYGIASVQFEKLNGIAAQVLTTITKPSVLSFTTYDSLLTRGENRYRLAIHLTNGATIYSAIETVYYFPDLPVMIYPNPARQNEPIKVIAKEPFIYAIEILDVVARKIRTIALNDFTNEVPAFTLPRGLYFIRVQSGDGKIAVQKIVVQ